MRVSRASAVKAASAVAVLLVVASPPAGASSRSPQDSSGSRVVALVCRDVGELHVVISTDAAPVPQTPLPPAVSLVTSFRGTNSRTGATVSGGTAGDVPCGTVAVQGASFAALSARAAPAGGRATDRYNGSVSIGLVVGEPAAVAVPSVASPSAAGGAFPSSAVLRSYLSSRSGHASVAMFDATSGAVYAYGAGTRYVTASIVKVTILGTLLRQAQVAGRSLTSTERSQATRMIERSDNGAATALWNDVGRGAGVRAFLNLVGMASTTPGSDGLWGLTSTSAPDQVRLLRVVAYPNPVLSDTSRAYLESLMRAVIPAQRWGVSAGAAAGSSVALKNGWLPYRGGWVINSIGHIRGGARDYVVAVLSSGSPSMGYGVTTVEHVSGVVGRDTGVTRLSDMDGDGFTDLVARDGAGVLWLYPGNGAGGFLARRPIGGGWNAYDALVTPGDVTGDGRADVVARDTTGVLWVYPGNGSGGLLPRRQIGHGWTGYQISEAANLNGSGRPDLVAVDPGGVLWLYPVTGDAVFGDRIQVGGGWSGFTVTGPGDLSGDGNADILARDPAGVLWLYPGNGAGGVGAGQRIGGGWSDWTALVTPGDWDRRGGNDLLARNSAGDLWLYPGNSSGGFSSPRLIGHGWQGSTFIG